MALALKAKQREILGKKTKQLRASGVLPGVIYGWAQKAQNIELNSKEFQKIRKSAGESGLIELELDGHKKPVLIKEIQADPVKGEPIHVDFYAARMDKPIKASIPIDFTGESPAVKNLGGSLVKVMREIEVEALPADLPPKLEADISTLNAIGDRFLVSDFKIKSGVKILGGSEDIVALVEEPKKEEAAEAKPSLEEIEVVGKKGKEAPPEGEKAETTAKEKTEKIEQKQPEKK